MTMPRYAEGGYERRIRIASEVATWGVAGIEVASAALPTTDPVARVGLLFSASLLAVFALIWFHLLPPRVLGRLRFTVGTCITQMLGAALLVLTGGSDSRYFAFFLFPVLATTFAMRISATLAVGTVAVVAYVTILISDGVFVRDNDALSAGAVHFSALVALIAMTVLISRTMQDTRSTLRQRSIELAAQNQELEVARSTTVAISRARDLGELLRAAHESARSALATKRLFYFAGPDEGPGWTVGPDGAVVAFEPDPRLHDSPRQRALRDRRTVVVNDSAQDPGVTERTRSTFQVASALFVPLQHRGGFIGLIVFSDTQARQWAPREVRLAEVIAESMAPSIASNTALEEVRDERETLAGRMRVLEGLNQLVEALSLARDERSTAQVAARAIAQGFRLMAATTLFVDPSIALLEPEGTAGAARVHPVVNGPTNCPAIRSARMFEVKSAEDPVICPYMPFIEGSNGYVCAPLVAGSESVGALFMEPTVGSVVEEAFVRAAADRVALSLANRRVLETAQRQATTDGLTGLHNRHFLAEQLRVVQSLAARHSEPYSVIALDIDGLKQVNDTFGHEMGDLALRGFANTLRKTLREADISFRTGGDEFLVLVPRGKLHEARQAAERVREAVVTQGHAEPHTAITVSAGVAAWRPGRTAEQVLEAADSMLYAAKRAGKDRVMVEAPAAATEGAPGAP
ncbi:MAG TPA: diguanylate cyclase [Candidatus Acidoferrales bacterium]|nr:diguanylate cyclase [Candidatus Acidoferrales bacterium]